MITALFLVGTFFCDLSVSLPDSSVLSSCLTLDLSWSWAGAWLSSAMLSLSKKHLSWFKKLSLLPSLYLCHCPLAGALAFSAPGQFHLLALPSSKLNLFLQNHGLLLRVLTFFWSSGHGPFHSENIRPSIIKCPGSSDSKASAYHVGDQGSIPGSGRSPGEGNGNPLQYSCLENPMDGEAWWATIHGVAKSQTLLNDFTFFLAFFLFSFLHSSVILPLIPSHK